MSQTNRNCVCEALTIIFLVSSGCDAQEQIVERDPLKTDWYAGPDLDEDVAFRSGTEVPQPIQCGSSKIIDEHGNIIDERPHWYYLDHMNLELEANQEFADAMGTHTVQTCDEALRYMELEPTHSYHVVDEHDKLPLAPEQIGSDENEDDFRIYSGSTRASGIHAETVVRITGEATGVTCTGTFITQYHVLTSAHCIKKRGFAKVNLKRVNHSADNNILSYVYVNPGYSGEGNRSYDMAIISLREPTWWSHSRMRIHAGSTRKGKMLDIFGWGAKWHDGSGSGQVLRAGSGGHRIKIDYHKSGWFEANAYDARACSGDSGGPAVNWLSSSRPIIWGVHKGSRRKTKWGYERRCPNWGYDMWWTKPHVHTTWIANVVDNNIKVKGCIKYKNGTADAYLRCD